MAGKHSKGYTSPEAQPMAEQIKDFTDWEKNNLYKAVPPEPQPPVTSQPSKPVYDVHVPKTKIISSKFIYNFFVKDESVNDQQNINVNNVPTANKLQRLPRFNKIEIKNGAIKKNKGENNVYSFSKTVQQSNNSSINTHYDKILNESNFDNAKFTGISFKDSGVDGKLNAILMNALNSKLLTNLYQVGQQNYNEPPEDFVLADASALDIAKVLNNITSDKVDEHFITDIIIPNNTPSEKTTQVKKIDYKTLFEKIKDISVDFQLNNATIDDVITNVINDPLTLFTDELITIQEHAKLAQDSIIALKQTTDINADDYYSLVNFVMLKYQLDNEFFTSKIVGYIINKFEQNASGLKTLEDIIIDNPNTTVIIDQNIKYGTKYLYDIKTIGSITLDVIDIETKEVYDAELYITSTASETTQIDCFETVSPPHPYDFKITYDYEEQASRLTWAFPPNTQRDIKYFQIFRRATINEPFQLIKQFDFNDALVKYPFEPGINQGVIDVMQSPKTYFIDYDFSKKSSCIYALCSVDAHGISSPYSMQIEAMFDTNSNTIQTKLVSVFGSPKQYPNLYVDEDMFQDVIKTTGYKKCHLYFEPEFLELYKSSESVLSDLKLLSTDKNDGKYILQIINTDNQKQQNVSITLNDKREKQSP